MSAELEIIRASVGTVECVFEGTWALLGYRALDPEDMRRSGRHTRRVTHRRPGPCPSRAMARTT